MGKVTIGKQRSWWNIYLHSKVLLMNP
jgi:hypothetical protein